jgi:MFS family permease
MPQAIPGLCSSAMTNRNVKIFYAFNGLQSLGRGIWMGNILSLYIVLLAESSSGILGLTPNELLGATSAVTGVALLISVLPGGFLADKWSIRGTLLLGAVVGTAGLSVLLMSAELAGIVVGMFLWGMFQGFSRPAAEAMLANSTVSGDRSGIYARAHLIDQLGMGTGPLLNILLFLYLGDVWELSVLRSVMSVGIGLSFLSTLVILAMRKSDMLGDESEALPGAEPVNESTQADGSDSLAQDGEGAKPGRIRQLLQRRPGAKYIPHIFLASSFIIGFGAGMTVKFFPVFFPRYLPDAAHRGAARHGQRPAAHRRGHGARSETFPEPGPGGDDPDPAGPVHIGPGRPGVLPVDRLDGRPISGPGGSDERHYAFEPVHRHGLRLQKTAGYLEQPPDRGMGTVLERLGPPGGIPDR